MRTRLASLLSAVLLVALAVPAAAQYPAVPPGTSPAETIGCVVDFPPTLTTDGQWTCTAAFLADGTTFTFTAVFPRLQAAGNFSQSDTANSAAVAFVGAQADGITATITGTVAGNGVALGSGPIPAGADTSGAFSVSFTGTAEDGSPITLTTSVGVTAPAPAPGDTTVPATGAESGVLALIALGLVGAGGGAVVLARRRSRVEA